MTTHDWHQIAAYWVSAGGPSDRSTEWAGICNAESGRDDEAVSPDGAIGLWQIMPFNAHIGGGGVGDLFDPTYNAKVAVIMSGGGTNCAAWDSCYVNIFRSGRYRYLSWPESDSSAWRSIIAASAGLGTDTTGGASLGSVPSLADGMASAVDDVRVLATIAIPNLTSQLWTLAHRVEQLF